MGLSFQGPNAPRETRPRLLPRAGRILLAATLSLALTALATAALNVATGPPIASYLLQPFSLLLVPGAFLESLLDANPYAFTPHRALFLDFLFYTLLFALLIRPRKSN